MEIPKENSEKILVCNGALAYHFSGSFFAAYDVCEAPGDKEIITKYKELIETLSECIVDAMMDYMWELGSMSKSDVVKKLVDQKVIRLVVDIPLVNVEENDILGLPRMVEGTISLKEE